MANSANIRRAKGSLRERRKAYSPLMRLSHSARLRRMDCFAMQLPSLCLHSSFITSSCPLYIRMRNLSRSLTPASFSHRASSKGLSKYRLLIKYSPPFFWAFSSCCMQERSLLESIS